jgi:class 3 adenylate cyclase/tetratricopeptide (TPR) repeat protein
MMCPRCRCENRLDSKFCLECGSPFASPCVQCGAELPASAKFCDRCGQQCWRPAAAPPAVPLPTAPPTHLAEKILQSKSILEGERKQVTVLFADVKGSMELAEQMDPEAWSAIMGRFFKILADGIERFEGFVDKFTGDGIMALFGAPIAHEDHAHRACYAALHLRDTLKIYADALRIEQGLNFSVRIGLNSGEVVVGRIGDDLRMEYTAQGHTVGLAQRMETLAEPGKALLAGGTIDIVQGYFALRDLGTMNVKGVDAPVRVAELEGVGRMRTRLDRSRARGLSTFVGRDEEMARLETALRRALDGDGQVVGMMAEAGSGKSRLCYEFLERCRARGITVRTGTGVPHGRAVPLQPILEFYRETFDSTSDDTDAQTRQKIAGAIAQMAPEELGSLPLLFDFMRVPDPAQPAPELAPEERMRAVMAMLRRITAARSRREPAVLVFEDLHWIDADTEAIIEGFVDAAAGTRTLVLLNFRPEYRASWVGRTHYQQMALRPLDATAAGALLGDWLGSDPSLAGFVELVCARTGGNPFFMEEVVQAQIESGALVGVRGAFRLQHPIGTVEVPASVQSLLAARIDRLGEASKRLLQTAAVIGDDVVETVLERVAALDRDALRSGIRHLMQSEFLYEASLYPHSEYAFKHPLTREVAYASLLRERRRTVHAAVATVLEALAGEAVDQRAPLLAHHWEQAGRPLEAARWQARTAARLGSNAGAAILHWTKVTTLLADEHDSPEARALLGQARARLVYAAGRSGVPEAEVAKLFAEARRELGDTDSRDLAWTLGTYAIIRNAAGHIEEGHRLGGEAVAMARRLEDPAVLAASLATSAILYPCNEFPDEGARLAAEIEHLCAADPCLGEEMLGFRPWVLSCTGALTALPRFGRGGEAEALLAQFRSRIGDSRNTLEQVALHYSYTLARAARGDVNGALEHGRQALEWAMQSQNLWIRVVGHTARGRGLLSAGRFDEALEQLEQAMVLAIDRSMSKAFAVAPGLPLLAETQLRRGDIGAARAAAERGIELAREIGYRHAEAINLVALARVLAAGADAAGADAALARASELAAVLDARDLPPCIEEVRAELARRRRDDAGCERAVRAAARLHRDNGEEWLATQAEERVGSSLCLPNTSSGPNH